MYQSRFERPWLALGWCWQRRKLNGQTRFPVPEHAVKLFRPGDASLYCPRSIVDRVESTEIDHLGENPQRTARKFVTFKILARPLGRPGAVCPSFLAKGCPNILLQPGPPDCALEAGPFYFNLSRPEHPENSLKMSLPIIGRAMQHLISRDYDGGSGQLEASSIGRVLHRFLNVVECLIVVLHSSTLVHRMAVNCSLLQRGVVARQCEDRVEEACISDG